ncbi:MAG: nuclear transport factor 2 family protein [Woeseiaceae bacterium]|nr:nuclear transport factor 2 family protein [Woeseiaceae bacterium]
MAQPVIRGGNAATETLAELFASVDRQDTEAFLRFLTEDATFRFGSAPPVTGKDAIGDAVRQFFSTIAGCRHTLHNVVGNDSTLVCEGEVTYTRHDRSEISLPFVNVFEFAKDLIANYKIYIDAARLYEPDR